MNDINPVNDSFEDPIHTKDQRKNCSWCDASWEKVGHGTGLVINHKEDCAYMAALQEGDKE